jgi:hypothetical protein
MFTKFTSIESFSTVWKYLGRRMAPGVYGFGSKVKLHGTNGGVRVHADGTVVAQSRSRDLSTDEDNAGFAAWVESTRNAWAAFAPAEGFNIFFGEWAGKGIQQKDAVTKLEDKYFFVFAVEHDGTVNTDLVDADVPDLDQVLVLDWHVYTPENPARINFSDSAQANEVIEGINKLVEAIGEADPYIKDVFDVDGPGEGLVFTPIGRAIPRDEYGALTFKAKAEAHRVKKSSDAVKVRVETPTHITAFADMFVTEARCMQGLTEACAGSADKTKTSAFLKWMGNDVEKESVAEREEMGVEWKQVAGFVAKNAARWYMKKCEELEVV